MKNNNGGSAKFFLSFDGDSECAIGARHAEFYTRKDIAI
jgi:hypothetical protein